jgi:hypothetical protein
VEVRVGVLTFLVEILWKLVSFVIVKDIFLGRNFLRCHDDILTSFFGKGPTEPVINPTIEQ